jgi:hypothetical protein
MNRTTLSVSDIICIPNNKVETTIKIFVKSHALEVFARNTYTVVIKKWLGKKLLLGNTFKLSTTQERLQ